MCTSRRTDVGMQKEGKELEVIPSGGVFFVAAKPSKLLSRKAGTQFDVTSRGRTSNVDKSPCRILESLALRQETRWTEMNRRW